MDKERQAMDGSTDTRQTLHEQLRMETRSQHEQLHSIVRIDQMLQSMSEYASGLKRYHRAISALEDGLAEALAYGTLPKLGFAPWRDRLQKTQWIEEDLQFLGERFTREGPVSEPTLSVAIARAYLLEGMMLGGQQIVKQIRESLHIDHHSGARFFTGYGAQTGQYWIAFKHWLSEIDPVCDREAVIDSAKQAFLSFATLYSAPICSSASVSSVLGPTYEQ